MTSVPKPLKFLRPHYSELEAIYNKWPISDDKSLFADILGVLAMTYSDTRPRETLKYRLISNRMSKDPSPPGLWGHEYIRHLSAELGAEFLVREESETAGETLPASGVGSIEELRELGYICAKFLLEHNAEADAVDLLEELECVNKIADLVDQNTYTRVCQYMVSCVPLLPPPDDVSFLRTAHAIYSKFLKYPEALSLSIRLGDAEMVAEDFQAPANPAMQKQLAFILARAQVPPEWLKGGSDDEDEELPEELQGCLNNAGLSTHFRAFGKELGAEAPKSLEDIYKTHLEHTRAPTTVDSARGNLAGTFVNAFVNAGFGNDPLMVAAEEGNSWIYKNKEHGMLSAAASVGMSCLWDVEDGLGKIDKYTYSGEEWIKGGALLAIGILHANVRSEHDAPVAMLTEHLENKSVILKTNAIVGLGLAYAGSHREDLMELILPIVADDTASMEVVSLAALTLGFIFVGSANGEIAETILQTIMERMEPDESQLSDKWARFLILGLALLYVGRQDASDATVETLKAIPHAIAKQAQILVDICSFAGTGNVLKVQSLLHHCADHIVAPTVPEGEEAPPKEDDTYQAFAVLGVALVAMGEDVGAEMSLRQFNHLMTYGEPVVRKTVPLALGLLSASNPQLSILDTLSKYSHDNDLAVALNAIVAMGLVGAGTNNARLAQMLRQLAGYYHKEPDCLFMVRVAQGLVHMGKGTVGINPFWSDRQIMSRTAVAGILATLIAFTNAQAFIMDKSHWMLYFLTTAMFPRFLITLDEDLNELPVTVRVGQAVDVVGQAGKPRTISGFQTHQTPVRMGTTERAELGTEQYIPFASVLEGFVVLAKNEGWEDDKMQS
ncbi:26S proteasome regulatory complex, non-ATPase subcomplex, Rpn1 subunit [Clavulina sp. PMI_390]|nr:26S proteasome regulatory complex, non-ATPase subcomplex, Rpn1 subunit [Clavulina sp. PMI_390]